MARILLIEDEDLLREILAKCLSAAGHTVTQAVQGRDGLRQYRAEPADLVITDIIMPEQEGIATVIQLHEEFPNVPIIAISGGTSHSPLYLGLAIKLGARRTLAKPFTPEELLRAITEVLSENPLGDSP